MADYNLGTAHGRVKIDADTDGIDSAAKGLGGLDSSVDKSSSKLGDFDRQTKKTAKNVNVVAATITVLSTRMALMGAAGIIAAGIGLELSGVIGLLPAAGAAGALALGTLATGVAGFGDALKNMGDPEKFAESLKKLSPEARDAAKAIQSLTPAWKDLQQNVQDTLFKDTGGRIKEIAATYLPMLKESMVTVAAAFNGAFHSIISLLQQTGRQADLRAILGASAAAVANLVAAFPPLVAAFIDIAAVGAPIFRDLTAQVAPLAEKFAAFIAKARESGQLGAWIQTGLQAFRDLWTIVSLLTGTVVNLIAALGGPDSLMGVLMLVAQALNMVSGFIRDNATWIMPLVTVIGTVTAAYKLWMLALGLHGSAMSLWATITSSSALKAVGAAALAGAQLAAHYARMTAAGALWVASQISQGLVVAGAWLAMAGRAVLHAGAVALAWTTSALKVAAAWLLMATQATLHAARVAAAWLLTTGASMATALARMAISAALYVAQWIIMAVAATANALIAAAAWFIALGPIGWAIAALIAVVAFVIYFWDDIVRIFQAGAQAVAQWMQNAWQWIQQAWDNILNAFRAAGDWIANIMSNIANWIAGAVSAIVQYFYNLAQGVWSAVQQAWNAIVNGWNGILSFMRGIPGWIAGIFAGAWGWLVGAGQAIISGLANGISAAAGWVSNALHWIVNTIQSFFGGAASWLGSAGYNLIIGLYNGIMRAGGWVYNAVTSWARGLINGVKRMLGIGSPSKIFDQYGQWLMEGLANGVDSEAFRATKAALSAAQGVVGAMRDGLAGGANLSASIGTTLSEGQQAALSGNRPLLGGTGATAASGLNPITGVGTKNRSDYATASGTVGGKSVTIEMNTYNPVAEKASDSEARKLRAAAAVGAF